MDDSKDAEVRARVTPEMFRRLSGIATSRGEQIPVIVREALAEYLAKRVGPEGSPPDREAILDALRDKPIVIQALLDLAEAVRPTKPVNYRPSKKDNDRKAVELVKAAAAKKPHPPASPHPTRTK